MTSEQSQAVSKSAWSAVNLGTAARTKDNNFRVIRHVAAAAVIFSHAFIVNEGMSALAREPVKAAFGISIAEIAVNVFFIVSGFLVTHSLVSRGSLVDFFLARVLRIYPALILVALLSAFILGPLTSELPLREYLSNRAVYRFVAFDTTMLSPMHTVYGLPGVFTGLPYPDVVNASLWTLPWELLMYWLLAALFVTRLVRRPVLWAVPIYAVYVAAEFGFLHLPIYPMILIRFLSFFYAGALLSICRDRISLSPIFLICTLFAFVIITWLSRNAFLLPPFLAYAVIFLAHYPKLVASKLSHGADLSYGIYIFAYPIQQLLVWQFGPHDPYLHSVIALAITMLPAYLSWTYIENPCLSLKSRIRDRYISSVSKASRPRMAD